jgi:U3 small nucleolar ribonucleoprotein component
MEEEDENKEEEEGDGQKTKRRDFDDAEVEDDVFEEAREKFLANNTTTNEEIERLEQKLIDPKGWQYRGEIKAGARPKDSLLEEHLDYQTNRKIPDAISVQQYTLRIDY